MPIESQLRERRDRERRQARADLFKIWGAVLFVVLAGFAVAIFFLDPPPPDRLVIATGSEAGAYYAFAQAYKEEMARDGVELVVRSTAGSVENLELLRAGEADLALVQGGVSGSALPPEHDLRALASVFLEPVWIFYRPAALEAVEVEGEEGTGLDTLDDLAGARIAIGAEGSGTRPLALQLLAENGIGADDATLDGRPTAEAVEALAAGELDAAFFVAAPDAAYVETLLRRDDVAVFEIERYRAYHRIHPFLSHVVLSEGVLDLAENVPGEDTPLLAAAASLVAREDLHEALIPLLLRTMQTVHAGGGLLDGDQSFPNAQLMDLPLLPAARQYLVHGPSFLHRILPFRVAVTLDRLKILLLPLLTLLFPLFKAAPPIYRWRIRSKIYRWYDDLRIFDELLFGEDEEQLSPEEMRETIGELRELEREVVEEVSVPLSYMDSYYHLRVHIQLMIEKLEERLEGSGEPGPSPASAARSA